MNFFNFYFCQIRIFLFHYVNRSWAGIIGILNQVKILRLLDVQCMCSCFRAPRDSSTFLSYTCYLSLNTGSCRNEASDLIYFMIISHKGQIMQLIDNFQRLFFSNFRNQRLRKCKKKKKILMETTRNHSIVQTVVFSSLKNTHKKTHTQTHSRARGNE